MTVRAGILRHTTVLFLVLAGGISVLLFSVKYQVRDLETDYKRLSKELNLERRAVHVLHAEWATLNDPKRIGELAAQYLDMVPIAPAQVVGPDAVLEIPVREINFGEGPDGDPQTSGKTP